MAKQFKCKNGESYGSKCAALRVMQMRGFKQETIVEKTGLSEARVQEFLTHIKSHPDKVKTWDPKTGLVMRETKSGNAKGQATKGRVAKTASAKTPAKRKVIAKKK